MSGIATLPGIAFAAVPPVAAPSPLRTDFAAFAGSCLRGPVGEWLRIEGWRRFEAAFGGFWRDAHTPYAVRGYFENGGEVAWLWRLGSADAPPAETIWDPPADFAAQVGLPASRFILRAASPGAWATAMNVTISFRNRFGAVPELDIESTPHGLPPERVTGLPCTAPAEALEQRSNHLRLVADGPPPPPAPNLPGPLRRNWALRLGIAAEPIADAAAYEAAIAAGAEVAEPALFAMPDLAALPPPDATRLAVAAVRRFAECQDRMVLLDLPATVELAADAAAWLDALGDEPALPRAAAAYHPWLRVEDPLGTPAAPQRSVPPSGHVAGLCSRLDRSRGAGATPANDTLDGVFDVDTLLAREESAGMYAIGINPLLCSPGRGILVWGGRMLGATEGGEAASPVFVAHRRLIHRLVRAVRSVARPLAFEPNGPALWFALARGATGVLLEAWRARQLKGNRPEQGFRVRCDAELNRPEVVEAGQVLCEISLAPAAPMEFITIRVALGADGRVEVTGP